MCTACVCVFVLVLVCACQRVHGMCVWGSFKTCVPNWHVDAARIRFMRVKTRAQAFTKKQRSESYLAHATPPSTNFWTPPVKVTGMYAGTPLRRAENSNMLELPFRRVSIRMTPKKPAKKSHKRIVSRVPYFSQMQVSPFNSILEKQRRRWCDLQSSVNSYSYECIDKINFVSDLKLGCNL